MLSRRLSLRNTLLGLIALATLAISLPGLGWLLHLRIEQERENLLLQTHRLARGAAPLLVNALVVGDLAVAEQTLAQLNQDRFFSRLSLLEPNSSGALMDASPPAASKRQQAPAWFSALLGIDGVSERLPIESGGQVYAQLLAEPDLDGVRAVLWDEARYLLGGVLALNVLLAVIIGVILTRGFRPIRMLGRAAERLGAGDLSARMDPTELPEVCPTILAFNSMADNMEKLLAEVRSQAAANRKLAAIVAQTDEAILTLDEQRTITSWNRGAERLLGFGAYEMLERPVNDLILSMSLDPVREVDEMLATRPPAHWETHLRRKSGGEALVAVSTSPLLDEQLSFVGYILVARDISRIKAAETALMHAKEAAETANRMKSEFLANMSHEIRTPMNGIIGMTDLALGTELNEEQQEYLGLVKSSANALLTVINDILDFSKIEAGRLDMETLPFHLRGVIGDTVKSQAIRLRDRPVELIYHVADDIPDVLLGDPGRLRQVLLNLLGNAIKFTEQGEIAIRVELIRPAASDPEDQAALHLSLRDTGIGIPDHKLAHIFDAFTQADSSITRRYGGTGLGLTITRRLVEMMGGGIWAESEEGRGSTFHFTARFGVGEQQPGLPPINLEGLRVLVVDDNSTNRRILCDTLDNAGVAVESANGGAAGLRALALANVRGQPFDVLLLDVQMPEMDGFTVADQIHLDAAYQDLRVVMLSSVGLRGDATYCRELGLAAYLTKPISPAEVLDAIRMVMGHTQQEARVVTRHSLHEQVEPPASQEPLNVLLVEDNPINQKLAVTLVQREGHRVTLAEHGQEALECMAEQRFDLILMDMQMPVMDGLECTRKIRAAEQARGEPSPVRIVAMTANAFTEDRERCLAAGMDDYLSKPLKVPELKRALAG